MSILEDNRFPIRVQLDDESTAIFDTPYDVPCGIAMKVVETNVKAEQAEDKSE